MTAKGYASGEVCTTGGDRILSTHARPCTVKRRTSYAHLVVKFIFWLHLPCAGSRPRLSIVRSRCLCF